MISERFIRYFYHVTENIYVALAEQPHTIQKAFLTDAYNPRGKYWFRLWDDINGKYLTLCVDDFVPVNKATGQPVFTTPNGNEMWVMLMEKAIAKLCGSYANIGKLNCCKYYFLLFFFFFLLCLL